MNTKFLLALTLFTVPTWAADGHPRERSFTVVTFTQEELDKATPPRRADDDDYRNIYGCNRKQEESCLIASIVTLSGVFLWLTTTQKSSTDANVFCDLICP